MSAASISASNGHRERDLARGVECDQAGRDVRAVLRPQQVERVRRPLDRERAARDAGPLRRDILSRLFLSIHFLEQRFDVLERAEVAGRDEANTTGLPGAVSR
jgi:hypothetical protein